MSIFSKLFSVEAGPDRPELVEALGGAAERISARPFKNSEGGGGEYSPVEEPEVRQRPATVVEPLRLANASQQQQEIDALSPLLLTALPTNKLWVGIRSKKGGWPVTTYDMYVVAVLSHGGQVYVNARYPRYIPRHRGALLTLGQWTLATPRLGGLREIPVGTGIADVRKCGEYYLVETGDSSYVSQVKPRLEVSRGYASSKARLAQPLTAARLYQPCNSLPLAAWDAIADLLISYPPCEQASAPGLLFYEGPVATWLGGSVDSSGKLQSFQPLYYGRSDCNTQLGGIRLVVNLPEGDQ